MSGTITEFVLDEHLSMPRQREQSHQTINICLSVIAREDPNRIPLLRGGQPMEKHLMHNAVAFMLDVLKYNYKNNADT